MTPREYIETAMNLADEYVLKSDKPYSIGVGAETRNALETHLREHLDEIIESAYDKGLEGS